MKKLALVLAILVAFSATGLFADVSVGIFSLGSIGLMSNRTAGTVEDAQSVGPIWGGGGSAWSLSFEASNDNMGFNLGFDLGTAKNVVPAISGLSGYFLFLDGMVKVEAGLLDDGSYRLADYVFWDKIATAGYDSFVSDSKNDKYAGDQGIALTVKPMEALSASIFVPAVNDASSMDNIKNSNIALSYAIADTATIMAQIHLTADDASADSYSQIWVGVDVVAIENLGLRVTVKNTPNDNTIGLNAQYGMDAITLAEDFSIKLPSSGDSTITSETMVAYGLDIATVGVKARIDYTTDLGWGFAPYVEKFMGNGLIGAAFNVGKAAGAEMAWELPVYWKLWF